MERPNIFIVSVFLVFILAFSAMLCAQRVIDLDKVWGDIRLIGKWEHEHSGSAVASGDINGDGYMDIIISAPYAETSGGQQAGGVYVIFGSNDPTSIIYHRSYPDIAICGKYAYGRLGISVASGDINGDGYDDIITGAYGADPGGRNNAGETYVIFGSSFPTPPYYIHLNTQSADITVCGDDENDHSGCAVASGDANGDGYDDLIIGAWLADSVDPPLDNAGETYVIFGASFPSPPYTIDLSTDQADITVCGDDELGATGEAVASGDINGDGYEDIIIGADRADSDGRSMAGETYVLFGENFVPPLVIDLRDVLADITIKGEDADDWLGSSVSSGDINGDGYDDIIIGALYANPFERSKAGETYVVFGNSFLSPPYTIDLSTKSADITVCGESAEDLGDQSGNAVSSGDVNGDGYDDLIIGAWRADPHFGDDHGKTYVIFGSSSPDSIIDLYFQSADITVYGDDDSDLSGCAVTSGDVNGDGYYDLIIGASNAHKHTFIRDLIGVGEAYLISGGGAFITAQGLGGKSWINCFSLLGRSWGGFKAFGAVNSQGEVHLAVGEIDGDGQDEIAAGHGEGGSSLVKLFEVDGSLIRQFKAFGAVNTYGELHLAIGNFDTETSDKEIAVAQGEGGQSWVKVFKADGTFIRALKAFGGANAKGEVHLATGDLNKDGFDEIITGTGENSISMVKIFNYWGGLIRNFKAFDSIDNPGGEVRLAVGNFDADPAVEIAAATGYNGGNKVRLFDKDGTLIREFTAFGFGGNTNGDVQITAADIDNDGIDELVCGHGEGGGSWVKVFKADGTFIRSFKAFGGVNAQGEVHLGKSNY